MLENLRGLSSPLGTRVDLEGDVGVVREIKVHENRVALVPAGAERLVAAGHEVLVETGAGDGSLLPDPSYVDAGAEIAADAALENIMNEIRANSSLLAAVHDNNAETLQLLESPGGEADTTAAFTPGLQLRSAAWSAAITTGAVERLDYDLILELSAGLLG